MEEIELSTRPQGAEISSYVNRKKEKKFRYRNDCFKPHEFDSYRDELMTRHILRTSRATDTQEKNYEKRWKSRWGELNKED